MKRASFFLILIASFLNNVKGQGQKILSEGTLIYNVEIVSGNSVSTATNTIYLKGNNCRTDMVSTLGREVTIFNSKSDKAVILKEFSGQKLMITLTRENWKDKCKLNSNIKFELTAETKVIGNYTTKKAIAKSADGKSFVVYYTPEWLPGNKEYDPTFASLPGLPIEYEIESGKTKFKYSLVKTSYEPVQVSQFDFPNSGYRVMTYEENQQLKKGASK